MKGNLFSDCKKDHTIINTNTVTNKNKKNKA